MPIKFTPQRFWAKVSIKDEDSCWPWNGCKNNTGYGSTSWHGKACTAHRLAAFLSGLVPTIAAPKCRKGGGFVLHSCDNKLCCNPAHMYLGTYAKNNLDAYSRNRRLIRHGAAHPNTKLNTTDAETIRGLYQAGSRQVDLADKYAISQSLVSMIIRGKAYSHD
jgi:hypothetical protein